MSSMQSAATQTAPVSSLLSESVQAFRQSVEDPDQFVSNADGGDPGSPEKPSVWLFGVEPGWSLEDARGAEPTGGQVVPRDDRYSVEQQLDWPFNRNAFKLLSALDGGSLLATGNLLVGFVLSKKATKATSRATCSP